MIRIKICGITNSEDAVWAANFGADWIGLNFSNQSPRKVSPKLAAEISKSVPPFMGIVGVFVDEKPATILKIRETVPFKSVQLHGAETPEMCQELKAAGLHVIKAFRLQSPLEKSLVEPYLPVIDSFLFDTFVPDQAGGTGQTFNWDWLTEVSSFGKPWFLSGGLKPENIQKAIKQTLATQVDVCSGVEKSPKRKDVDAMKKFIQLARGM